MPMIGREVPVASGCGRMPFVTEAFKRAVKKSRSTVSGWGSASVAKTTKPKHKMMGNVVIHSMVFPGLYCTMSFTLSLFNFLQSIFRITKAAANFAGCVDAGSWEEDSCSFSLLPWSMIDQLNAQANFRRRFTIHRHFDSAVSLTTFDLSAFSDYHFDLIGPWAWIDSCFVEIFFLFENCLPHFCPFDFIHIWVINYGFTLSANLSNEIWILETWYGKVKDVWLDTGHSLVEILWLYSDNSLFLSYQVDHQKSVQVSWECDWLMVRNIFK